MCKIYILGAVGSGKTTLAKKLSNDLNITKEYWYMIRDGKRKPSDKLIFEISEKTKIDFNIID